MNNYQDQAEVPRANILIVDDTPNNLRLLSTINMPQMDGYEVCEQLKANDQTREIPVIFISALDDVLDKVKAFSVGGVDYITKPFQNEEVIARVQTHLNLQALQNALRNEQEKSERLLLNILPKAIAEELKQKPGATPTQSFAEATFLFADIAGFTPNSSSMPPAEVVNLLNQVFSTFDQLAERHGVEKMRTIGDSYFVAGGLPTVRKDHAEAIAEMALDMQQAITCFLWPNGKQLCLRVGINSGGPVVAAVIGIKKFAYDVWGDSVNLASRMESQGEAGRIQVTAATYKRLQAQYEFEKRGVIAVKGKGEMTTYWLTGKKANQQL